MAGRLTQATSTGGGATAGQPAFPSPADVQNANTSPDLAAARQAFVDTAMLKSRKLTIPLANPGAGQGMDIHLGKVGYPLGILLTVDATLTTTLIPSVSARYPYNLISSIIYQDPSNDQQRIITGGYQLYIRNRLQAKRFPFDPAISSPKSPAYSAGLYLAPTTLPSGTTQKLHFSIWVPLLVADGTFVTGQVDLRGIHSLASAKKNGTLSVTINPTIFAASASDDAVTYHNTGSDGCALSALTIKATEYYWTPVDPDGNGFVLPPIDDQMQIFEIKTNKVSSLNIGDDTPYAFETGRTYRRVFTELVSNGTLTTGNVANYTAPTPGATGVKFMLNDNNYLLWEDIDVYLDRIRRIYGQDLPVGVFDFDFAGREWNSDEYSDLQAILTLDPSFVGTGTSYMQATRECVYESDISQVAA